jgi:hypothetical protein
MSTIHLHRTITATPEQHVAALTDFGPGRSKIFGNSADEYLKVHHLGRTEADVTEGSGGICNGCTTTGPFPIASSSRRPTPTCGEASGHTYTFTRQANGMTDIDVVVVRDGKNLKGADARLRARDRRQGRFGKGV